MEEREKAIALLDSGVGGLTLVRELMALLPHENIIYFGDTARMPYGSKKPEQVKTYASSIIEFLATTQDIKMAIVACNTATAVGLEHYQAEFAFPVLGVLAPGVRAALNASKTGRIGVIGTEATIASGAYPSLIRETDPAAKVFTKACPLFVLLVENQLVETPEARRIAESYLEPLQQQQIDTLILGCTHYPLMEHVLAKVMGQEVVLVNSAAETALAARETLRARGWLRQKDNVWQRFFVSGQPSNFEQIGAGLLGQRIKAYQVLLSP